MAQFQVICTERPADAKKWAQGIQLLEQEFISLFQDKPKRNITISLFLTPFDVNVQIVQLRLKSRWRDDRFSLWYEYHKQVYNSTISAPWLLQAPCTCSDDHSGRAVLRHELSSLARKLGSWVRILLKAWVFLLCALFCVCVRARVQRADPPSKETECVKDQVTEKAAKAHRLL
jgi:hypothetical protein